MQSVGADTSINPQTLQGTVQAKPSLDGVCELPTNVSQCRLQRIAQIKKQACWDLVVIGGGITGAGVLKLASQTGLKVLLLEQKDFAWGSSSRSSKMVHGGLRYMAQGQLALTRESVVERQRLVAQGEPLVTKHSFAMSHYQRAFPSPWLFNRLLDCYDIIAGVKQHKFWPKSAYLALAPHVDEHQLLGGTQFFDALTDDARLVLRLIQESLQLGGQAINYAHVSAINSNGNSSDNGKQISVNIDGQTITINAPAVVNATGAWSNQVKASCEQPSSNSKQATHMRPLRGSHLVIPSWRLPVASVIAIRHRDDKRPVQVYPWQNVTIVGTTDVEHSLPLAEEARISQAEFDYLLRAVAQQFPQANIKAEDVISTFSGVRPVTTTDKNAPPSKEKREHQIISNDGVIHVTGGKLTTFRLIAEQVLQASADFFNLADFQTKLLAACQQGVLSPVERESMPAIEKQTQQQIAACYGSLKQHFIQLSDAQQIVPIRYSKHLWAELVWAVRYEQVQHLDDLLLRRTRLGNVLPQGAVDLLPQIQALCAPYMTWDEAQWQQEIVRYTKLWRSFYSVPSKDNDNKMM